MTHPARRRPGLTNSVVQTPTPGFPAGRLAEVSRPAGVRPARFATALALGSEARWDDALHGAGTVLLVRTGPTRCSRIAYAAYPPYAAGAVLDQLPWADPLEVQSARLTLQARNDLWLMAASCKVLWPQTSASAVLS